MTGVRPMIEKDPLAKAAEGYARMMSGKAEFRVVLTMRGPTAFAEKTSLEGFRD